jgi:DNA-binding response OmpR family regulator
MLTVKDEELTRSWLGANDYVTKPSAWKELTARKGLLRRVEDYQRKWASSVLTSN